LPQREIDFGFLFCEVSHFYSMSYREVLKMPVRAFWLMSSNIRRIRAQSDVRSLMVASAAQSPEGIDEIRERLVLEIGEVVKEPPASVERDGAGFEELRAMAAGM
jgi:hypothetical protein